MKVIIFLIQLASIWAKIDDFPACAKKDNRNCASIELGCCAQMLKFSDIETNPNNFVYYCMSYNDRVIWASKYIDEDDSNREYSWQCQDIDDPATGAVTLMRSQILAVICLLLSLNF